MRLLAAACMVSIGIRGSIPRLSITPLSASMDLRLGLAVLRITWKGKTAMTLTILKRCLLWIISNRIWAGWFLILAVAARSFMTPSSGLISDLLQLWVLAQILIMALLLTLLRMCRI